MSEQEARLREFHAMAGSTDTAALIAETFGLGVPTAPMQAIRHVSQEAWRLDTTSGSALVKRFWRGDVLPWRADLQHAMEFEQLAVAAGIDTPVPLLPRQPQFGAAAHIAGHGIFRAYPFLTCRNLEPADDVAEWLGETLARIHRLAPPLPAVPEPNWWYNQFPACPPEQWERWRDQGLAREKSWAPVLRENLPLIRDLARHVVEAFRDSAPHVMTHRDAEPWNVLMVPDRSGWAPILIDWDVAGPDSAPLEAAHVITTFARYGRPEPDREQVRRGLSAYRAAGGFAVDPGADSLARVLGMRLARIAERVTVSLGGSLQSVDTASADEQARDRITALPRVVAAAREWSEFLRG